MGSGDGLCRSDLLLTVKSQILLRLPATGIALSAAPRADNAPGRPFTKWQGGGSPGRPFNTMKRRQALVIIQTASKYSRYYYSSTSDPKVSNFAKSACF